MTIPHLILRLDAPLMSFGGVTVDNFGRTDSFPSTSLVTGLIANALGYDRTEGDRLDALQARIVYAARLDRAGTPLMDYQTVALSKDDKGWTSHGEPEGRGGGSLGTHIRERDFWADRIMTVALRLTPAASEQDAPDLDRVAVALNEPARPLFIGRKPCLPVGPLLVGRDDTSPNAVAALEAWPLADGFDDQTRHLAWWPQAEPFPMPADARAITVHGRKNWRSGVHGGEQRWIEGRVTAARPSATDGAQAA